MLKYYFVIIFAGVCENKILTPRRLVSDRLNDFSDQFEVALQFDFSPSNIIDVFLRMRPHLQAGHICIHQRHIAAH